MHNETFVYTCNTGKHWNTLTVKGRMSYKIQKVFWCIHFLATYNWYSNWFLMLSTALASMVINPTGMKDSRAIYFNSLLKCFCGYWETLKVFLSNILSSKIIPNKKFPDYIRQLLHHT